MHVALHLVEVVSWFIINEDCTEFRKNGLDIILNIYKANEFVNY